MAEAEASLTRRPSSRPLEGQPTLKVSPLPADARGLALLSLAAFAAAELVTTYAHPIAGVALHALILSGLIVAASLRSGGGHRPVVSRLLYSLTLVPLIRILSLSMPLERFEPELWYLLAGLPVFLAGLLVMRALELPGTAVGLHWSWSPWQPAVAALGLGLGLAEYHILRPQPLIDELTMVRFVMPALILMLATGFLEEFLFRGILQTVAERALGTYALLYVSALFTILHIGYQSATDLLFVLTVALIYGWVVRRTGSIMGVSISHGITNIMLFLVVPFLPVVNSQPAWLILP